MRAIIKASLKEIVGVIAILVCIANPRLVYAAEGKDCCMFLPWKKVENASAGNGIAVDQPKVFDNRSLVLMLEELESSIARLTAIDQTKLSQNIGLLQGIQKSEVSRALSISTLPLPGTVLTEQRDTNTGVFAPQQRVTTNAGFVPAAPTLAPESLPAISPSGYGIAAQDIFAEEINLTYQFLNLRMLLERSVTDRIHTDSAGTGGPRAQSVLGFQVSLNPMTQHKGRAAIVEVELTATGGKRPPSLVSLMPQAKTYNMAALSRKVNAFGVSAVVKVVSIGYSERHAGESYYLYRDTDTVAFERSPQTDKLVFGWEFRPVLNRTAVEPGIRQLFAVIALDERESISIPGDMNLEVKVRTYWADYDKKNAVISSGPCDDTTGARKQLPIPRSQALQSSLGPRVEKVELRAAANESVLVDVSGDNFYNGTTVVVGGRILDRNSPALLIKSDQLLQIAASSYDVVHGNIFLSGRYGLSQELVDKATVNNPAAKPDQYIVAVEFDPIAIRQNNELVVRLNGQRNPAVAPNLKGKTVIVTVGQQAFVIKADDWRVTTDGQALQSLVRVSADSLKGDTVVTAAIPFLGGEYVATTSLFRPVTVDRAVILVDGDPQLWGIVGTGFDDSRIAHVDTKVVADREYTPQSGLGHRGRNLLTVPIAKANVPTVKNLVVKIENSLPFVIPAPTQASGKALVNNTNVPRVNATTAPVLDFPGENLGQVAKVSFGKEILTFSVEEGKKLRVFLSRDVTAKPGRVSLAVEAKDGAITNADLDVQ